MIRAVLSLRVLLVAWLATALPLLPVGAQPSPTAIISRIRNTGNLPIGFHAAVFPDTVFVGQQITYQVAVLLSDEARSRLRRNPEFLPPELRGLLAFELGSPTRVPPRSYGGRTAFEAHVFQRALFAVNDGVLRVPAPLLTYSLPQSASYFSREERFMVRAESAQFVVKPLPADGRPDDFTGAVGVIRASARFDGRAARVGDPLVLTVRIEGTGNVRLWPRPVLELPWGTVVPGSERVQLDTSGAYVKGAREFDFLVTPTREGRTTVPVVRYPYFDPYRRAYLVAETTPADLQVASGGLAVAQPVGDGEQLPLRVWRRQESWVLADLPRTGLLVAAGLLLVAPVPALVVLGRRYRRRRTASRGETGVQMVPPSDARDASPASVARRTRRTLLAGLASRLHVSPTDLVTRRDLERVMRRRGVTRSTTREVLTCADELALLGFGGVSSEQAVPQAVTAVGAPELEARAARLLDQVDAEAVRHGRGRLWTRVGRRAGSAMGWFVIVSTASLMAVAPAVSARAQRPSVTDTLLTRNESAPMAVTSTAGDCRSRDSDARTGATPLDLLVGEATAAYDAHRFGVAAQRFASAVTVCPRDVDLLVNWGTAAWSAHDTVHAVIAWQRAARLDPLAADVQARLVLLPPGARSALADVPMIPVTAVAVVAVFAWLLCWALWFHAWRHADGRPSANVAGRIAFGIALAAAGTTWWGQRALDGSNLAVVRRPENLRAAPGYDAATVGGVSTGDVVRFESAQEGWFRVVLTDDRAGWLPAARVAPLLATSGSR